MPPTAAHVLHAAALCCRQFIDEHVSVFMYNNAIIRSFDIPWSAALRAALVVVPPKVWGGLLALAALLLALAWTLLARWRGAA